MYVLVLHLEKKDCWLTLEEFIDVYTPRNIIIARDLNLVFNSKEKRGGNNSKDQMFSLVEDIMQQWDILDIKPKRGLFT